jgi:hypothetical protein
MGTPDLERYVVSLQSPASDFGSYCATERILAYASASTMRTMTVRAHPDIVIRSLQSNSGDREDELDLGVRRHERPFSARFSPSRLPAILHGTNQRLYEECQRSAELLPKISVVAMTTVLGVLTVAGVGTDVVLHRVRRGGFERLTPPAPASRVRESPDKPSPSGLGQTSQAAVIEHSDSLEPNDIFVLSSEDVAGQWLAPALDRLSRGDSFGDALVDCFKHAAHTFVPALVIGRWVA